MPAAGFGHKQVTRPDGSSPESWHGYHCAHCGRDVTGAVLASVGSSSGTYIRWLQCSHCHHPAVQDEDNTYLPGKMFGPVLEGLPAEVDRAYDEVRRCMAANAFTAAEALCRKILMHIAVDKGAEEGGSFRISRSSSPRGTSRPQ